MHDKAFNIAKNSKYDLYQRRLALMVYNFFDKKTSGEATKNENIYNKKLAEELHKPIIRKFKKIKVHSLGADLPNMQLISKLIKEIVFYVLLMFLLNTHGLFLWKIKEVLQ